MKPGIIGPIPVDEELNDGMADEALKTGKLDELMVAFGTILELTEMLAMTELDEKLAPVDDELFV